MSSKIQYKLLSNNSTEKYFRVLPKSFPRIPYKSGFQDRVMCHWGQRKLLYSEVEFLSIASKVMDISRKNTLIVYIGAANGSHDVLFKWLFPDTQFLLYDPAPFVVREDEQFIIKTGSDGFFTDNSIADVLKISNGRKILFICDIRGDLDEFSIWENMKQQQRWGILLNAELMMLKLRFPYTVSSDDERTKKTVDSDFSYSLEQISQFVVLPEKKLNTYWNDLIYLDGNIYLQLYAPRRSSETRLITGKIKYLSCKNNFDISQHDKYLFTYYDSVKYEENMNYFNLNVRPSQFKYKSSSDMINQLIGFDGGYDVTGEYYICSKYFKRYLHKNFNHADIVHMMHRINNYLHSSSVTVTRTLATCSLVTTIDAFDDAINNTLHFYKKNNDEYLDMSNIAHSYYKEIISILELIKHYLPKQQKLIMTSSILSDKEKQEQLTVYEHKVIMCRRNIIAIIEHTNIIIYYDILSNILDTFMLSIGKTKV